MMGVVDVTSSTAPEPVKSPWQREQEKFEKWAFDLQLDAAHRVTRYEEISDRPPQFAPPDWGGRTRIINEQQQWVARQQLRAAQWLRLTATSYKRAVNRLFEIAPVKNRDDMSKFLRVIRKIMSEECETLTEVLDQNQYLDSTLHGNVTALLHDLLKCAFDNGEATWRSMDVVMGQALQVAKYEEVNWVALTQWIEDRLLLRTTDGVPGTGGRTPDVSRALTNAMVYGQYWDKDGSLLGDTLAPLPLGQIEGHPVYQIVKRVSSENGIRLGELGHRPSTICTRNPTAKNVVSEARAAWFPELDRPDGHLVPRPPPGPPPGPLPAELGGAVAGWDGVDEPASPPPAPPMPPSTIQGFDSLAVDVHDQNQWFADLKLQVKSGDSGFANVRFYTGSDVPFDPQAVPVRPIYPAHVDDAGLHPQQLLREFVHQVRYDAGLIGCVELIPSADPDRPPEYNLKDLYVQPGFMAVAWSLEWWSATNPTVDSFDYVSSDIDALNSRRATPHVFAEENTTAKDWFKAHIEVITEKDGADIQSVVRKIAILKQTLIDMQTRMRAEEEMPGLGPLPANRAATAA